jgi:hypothetical protein
MLSAVPECRPARPVSAGPGAREPLWPWSCRIAGASSRWPAVEVYEADQLLDVVSSARLVAQVLRGARVASSTEDRVIAWGRLPLTGGTPAVEFSRGWFRKSRLDAPLVVFTSWCWLAVADGQFDAVTVRWADRAVRTRVRRSCR